MRCCLSWTEQDGGVHLGSGSQSAGDPFGGANDPFTDICITIHNSTKGSYEVAMNIIVLRATTTRGTVLKGRSVRKVENL